MRQGKCIHFVPKNDGKERSLAEVVDMKKTLENEIDRLKNKRVELEEERRQILDDIGNQVESLYLLSS